MNIKDIFITEGTTHYINIDCFDENTKNKFDLNGYKAMFFLTDNDCHTGVIDKQVTIEDNTISVKLEPKDTMNKKELRYECRIFAENGDVFHVCGGKINISKSKIPIECLIEKYPK